MGMEFLSNVPGLVVENRLIPPFWWQIHNNLSIVDGLIVRNWVSDSLLIASLPLLFKTSKSSGKKWCNLLLHKWSAISRRHFNSLAIIDWYFSDGPVCQFASYDLAHLTPDSWLTIITGYPDKFAKDFSLICFCSSDVSPLYLSKISQYAASCHVSLP